MRRRFRSTTTSITNTYSGGCLKSDDTPNTPTGTTNYLDAFGVHSEVFVGTGGTWQWND